MNALEKLTERHQEHIMSHEVHPPQNPFKDYESGGIALAGCFMVGLGIGLLFKPIWLTTLVGAIIGIGVGMLAMALLSRDRYKQ
jgi:uncharacterized membrane-anchored protein YhcB (DUF1043 family)